ncbi:MAG: zf-HC2 domain-containing protein [Acidobacteria bacterium]|nr:zf-HC2 domain-containing protein [Acidobacteriota bacterium]MBI3471690.1 zf-HC2 domain-containing protein [Candidatus Solibacter usitatus]
MHQVIQDNLEEYLAGSLRAEDQRQVESHLEGCADCRRDLASMREMSGWLQSLRGEQAPEPASGFYARVSRRIAAVEEESSRSIWAALLEPAFARRVAFASLLLLASLGSFLVSRESDYSQGPTPELVLAVENEAPSSLDSRDHMLATLVSYHK